MRGITGVRQCLCDPNRVLGWSARPKPLFDDFGDPVYTSFLYDAYAVVMPAVNAPYVVARDGVPVGGTPKPDPGFSIALPLVDTQSGFAAGDYESLLSEVHGARVIYNDNGDIWATWVLGKKYDPLSGILGWGDGLMSMPCAYVRVNWKTRESSTYYLPPFARFRLPQDTTVDWWSIIPYGLASVYGGGHVWHPACVGFSSDGIVMADMNRVQDGIGNVVRFRFSDNSWSVGYGESATTDDGAYICMPAQMSGDGGSWVLAKEYNTKQMFTGRWTNLLGYHEGNLPIGDYGIADLPAVLTTAEQENRLDNKTGWSETYLDWLPISYTRRNGYDYVIVRPQDETGYRENIYFDGRLNRWSGAKGFNNIYAFENGEVVLAAGEKVKYVNADGTQRWLWEAPYSGLEPYVSGHQPFVSGNSESVQIKNVSLAEPGDTDPVLVREASTATLDNRDWSNRSYFYQPAITLSRQGNPPTCVIHRSIDRTDNESYQVNYYATNETLEAKYDGLSPQTHRAFITARHVGGMSFDCAPDCLCSCSLSGQIAY